MENMNEFRAQCKICGKSFKNTQGLRGHEMFKCKAKGLAPTTEEDLDTVQLSQKVLSFYDYARREGFEGTIEEFLDQTVANYYHLCARLSGKLLVEIARVI